MYLLAALFNQGQGTRQDLHMTSFAVVCKVSFLATDDDAPFSHCRMTVRQFAWASHEQGGPFVIYDVSEGLVYVDRQ